MSALAFSALRPGKPGSGGAPAERGAVADAQLLALAAQSRHEAFELLYATYRVRIHSFLLRFLADAEAADDVTQDAFTRAYAALPSLPRDAKLLPWLYRIASNAAIDLARRRRRMRFVGLRAILGTRHEPHGADPHPALSDREGIVAVLRSIPPENAVALLLHALEGYSYKEIATIQGASLTAVRSRIARARAAFKDRYQER